MHYTDAQWERIRAMGEREGATAEAMRKWRERGVPPKWQLIFMEKSKGKLSRRDLVPKEGQAA